MDIQQAINVDLLRYLNQEQAALAKQTLVLQLGDSGVINPVAKPRSPNAPDDRG